MTAEEEATGLQNKLNDHGTLGSLIHLFPSAQQGHYFLAVFDDGKH